MIFLEPTGNFLIKQFFWFFFGQEIITLQDKFFSRKCQIQQNFTEIHFKAQEQISGGNFGELQNHPQA